MDPRTPVLVGIAVRQQKNPGYRQGLEPVAIMERALRDASDVRELVFEYSGDATVAGYTVLYQDVEPWRAVAVFDLPDGRRTAAYSEDAAIIQRMEAEAEECCGRGFTLAAGRFD